jgi:hypothetical protein
MIDSAGNDTLYTLYRNCVLKIGEKRALIAVAVYLASTVDARVKLLREPNEFSIQRCIDEANVRWNLLCDRDSTLERNGFLEFMETVSEWRVNRSGLRPIPATDASPDTESKQSDAGK